MKKKKVLVAMSGGIDSAVTACLLKKKGFEVIGIHMRLWKEDMNDGKEAGVKKLAKKIGIPLIVLDLRKDFRREIVREFLSAYSKGKTPNPCVRCNRILKFGILIKKMEEMHADFLATGHYMRIRKKKKSKGVEYELIQAKCKDKDQSYFLYTLNQDQLKRIIFPVGGFTKMHVRELAKSFDMDELNSAAESQNLCFVSSDTDTFIKKFLKKSHFKKGKIMDVSGNEIGTHGGLPLYTIGQRKGIGMGGVKGRENVDPLYVVGIDHKNNVLIVGGRENLFRNQLTAENLSFISGKKIKNGAPVLACIRYHSAKVPAKFYSGKRKGTGKVIFNGSVRAVTPGQSVVFYKRDKVLGGGIIT
jgi:tRNA-uridine 2-sulfurtransferase